MRYGKEQNMIFHRKDREARKRGFEKNGVSYDL
jgi:hypothetical protein